MSKLLSFDKFCENLPDVTSTKVRNRRQFHPLGLFSEQIFGPIKNYTCQCGGRKFHGIMKNGSKCENCGVDIVHASERRRRFARIALPFSLLNPVFVDLLKEVGGSYLLDSIKNLMESNQYCFYEKTPGEFIVSDKEQKPEEITKYSEGKEAILNILNLISEDKEIKNNKNWEIIKENINLIFINYVPVIPPDLRPPSKGENIPITDDINRIYMHILQKISLIKSGIIDLKQQPNIMYDYYKQLQYYINEMYKFILSKIAKKEGLIRSHILGKRIDFSGRAVIIPDPTLSLDECSLPYVMFLELFKIKIAKRLIELSKFKLLNDAVDFIDKCIEFSDPRLFSIVSEMAENENCILNRQPSLHRLNFAGFKIKLSLDKVIKIHPLVCSGYNADFDGDQMAVYIPISDESKEEINEKVLITRNFTNPADMSLTTVPSQDIVYGIYLLTSEKFKKLSSKVIFKGEEIDEGKKLFNLSLPDNFRVIKNEITGKELVEILNEIKDTYNTNTVKETLDKIKYLGFKYSTLYGSTLSLDKFVIPTANKIRDEIYSNDNIDKQLEIISGKDLKNILKEKFYYSSFIESRARGNWDQVRQIVLSRGFISNFSGDISEVPVKNSLIDGLDKRGFFYSTYGSRKGLLDTALNTGASGYLSRKLIFGAVNLQASRNFTDCGTNDYFRVFVNSEKKAKMLVGRYFLDGERLNIITQQNYKEIIGKTILLRSPIFCENEEICHICYGTLIDRLHSRFIGIIAAQCLGECNTQLVLRTFHTSGVAQTKGNVSPNTKMKQMDVIGDLSSVSKLFHVSGINKDKKYEEIISEVFEIYNSNKDILHIHFESIVSQMMWVKNEKWRLLKNRNEITPSYYSILSIPAYEGWILGMAMSDPRKNILKGLLREIKYEGVMDKILSGKKIS